MITRILAAELAGTSKSVLLLGPRQTGKSTLIQSLRPELEINLANELTFFEFSRSPGELNQRIEGTGARVIFIDEVQRLPALLNTVQALVDASKSEKHPGKGKAPLLKFYLSGSSARKLRRGNANLLPGRVLIYELGPLVSAELAYRMNDRDALAYGCLPEAHLEKRDRLRAQLLKGYGATYLKEEIQAESLSRNLSGFARFLQVAAENSGKFLDISKLSVKAKVPRQSVVRYFEILEDTLLVRTLHPFPHASRADLVRHPRYFFFDPGVLNGILGNFVASADRIGTLFEHLLVNQIYYSAKAKGLEVQIWNFRTRGGLEVDFMVELEGVLWAIEAKATAQADDHDFSALNQIQPYCSRPLRLAIATLGNTPRKKGKVLALPWQNLLKEMGL